MRMLDRDYWHSAEGVHVPILGGRLAAEAGSILLATRIVPLVELVAPHRYDALKHKIAVMVVAPRLDWFEKNVVSLPAFGSVSRDLTNIPDNAAKAERIASALVDFSAMSIGGLVGQGVTQGVMNRFVGGLPALKDGATGFRGQWNQARNLAKPIAFDKAIGLSLVGLMQFGVPKETMAVTQSISDVLQKTLGIRPETTEYFLSWQVPRLLGFGGSALMMTSKYRDVYNASATRVP